MALALIVAAGSGTRLGAGVPKALVELAGRPLLAWSLEVLVTMPEVSEVVVSLPPGVAAPDGAVGVPGGATRSESVRAALVAAAPGPADEVVLVHDAARPLVTQDIVRDVLRAVEEGADGAVAAAPVSDTIKRAGPEGRVVTGTLDRGELWAVQTPQGFRRGMLEQALGDASAAELAAATDDASLIEARGATVVVVPASAENLKVTTARDLLVAEALMRERARSEPGPAEAATRRC